MSKLKILEKSYLSELIAESIVNEDNDDMIQMLSDINCACSRCKSGDADEVRWKVANEVASAIVEDVFKIEDETKFGIIACWNPEHRPQK